MYDLAAPAILLVGNTECCCCAVYLEILGGKISVKTQISDHNVTSPSQN